MTARKKMSVDETDLVILASRIWQLLGYLDGYFTKGDGLNYIPPSLTRKMGSVKVKLHEMLEVFEIQRKMQ